MKHEAFVSEITVVAPDGDRIAILKHFDGDGFEVVLERALLDYEDALAIANTIRNIKLVMFNMAADEKDE